LTLETFVKGWRESQGYSQEELGLRLGVHRQYISNLERGVYNSPAAICSRLIVIMAPKDQSLLWELLSDKLLRKRKSIKKT